MKHRLFILAVLLGISATVASAKIWRVDNVNPADFSALQEAHDGAESGDTLYVAGSVHKYAALTLEKTLYVFGPGYFLGENPDTQASPNSATVSTISLNPGSEGSLITGLHIPNGLPNSFSIDVAASGVVITRNAVSQGIRINQASNIFVSQNYLLSIVLDATSTNTNIIIANNIIASNFSMSNSSSAEISNNVVHSMTAHNSNVTNNIIRGNYSNINSNNIVSNNMVPNDALGTENGNQSNVDMSTVFVGAGEGSTDGQWQLAENSPAIGAGLGGVDLGAFGGPTPYVLSGLPSMPAIYFLNAPISGSTNSGLQVQLKAKGHN